MSWEMSVQDVAGAAMPPLPTSSHRKRRKFGDRDSAISDALNTDPGMIIGAVDDDVMIII